MNMKKTARIATMDAIIGQVVAHVIDDPEQMKACRKIADRAVLDMNSPSGLSVLFHPRLNKPSRTLAAAMIATGRQALLNAVARKESDVPDPPSQSPDAEG